MRFHLVCCTGNCGSSLFPFVEFVRRSHSDDDKMVVSEVGVSWNLWLPFPTVFLYASCKVRQLNK